MFRILFLFVFTAALLSLSGQSNMAHAQSYHTLANGMQVVIHQDQRFPLVSMRLFVRAGSAHEQPGQEGISHFLEHMVFKGTHSRAPGQVAREVEEVGGHLNAGTSFDYTVYTIELPAHEWKLGLDILQDMIFGSTFDPQELSQEISVVLAEIERSRDNPGSRIFNSIQSTLFHGTPYAHPILGYSDTVCEFDRNDLQNYISRLYQPGSMVLSLSGDIDLQPVLNEAQRLFGELKNRNAKVLPSPVEIFIRDRSVEQRVSVEHGPWTKAYMAVAVPAPELSSPMTAAFDILAYLLGGDRTSLLYREFKYEQGLVDQISARAIALERTGLLYFYAGLSPDGVEPFREGFLSSLADLKEAEFTREHINRAVVNIEESIFRSRETLGGNASRLGFHQLFENDPRAEEKYLHNLKRVTRKDLQEIIDSYLCPDNMAVSVLLPDQVKMSGESFINSLARHSPQTRDPDPQARDAEDKAEVIDLGRGRKMVIMHDRHLPHASLSIAWPGANSLIPYDHQGLPQLTASALTRETEDRSFHQIQEFLRDRAASISASASRNIFTLNARYPASYSSDILGLVAEIILKPTFSPNELQRAASDQVAEIRQQEDRPLGYAFRHLFPFLFSSGSYSHLQLGEQEFVLGVTPEMARSFWEKQKSAPFVISVCGDIDRHALDRLVADLSAVDTMKETVRVDFSWSEIKTKDVVLRDRAQAHLLMVFPVPGKKHEHSPALNVMNKVLAGQGGILFRELRDRQGLAYSVTSLLWQSTEAGFLALYIGTYEDRVDEALKGFKEIVARLRSQSLESDEVRRASNLIFGEYHRGRQTIASRSGEAAGLLALGLELDFNLEMTEAAGQVTPQELKKLAVKYLDLEKRYLMRVLPGN